MSKRILFLLMLAFTCAFMLVGCGDDGSDGKDASVNVDAIKAELYAQLQAGFISLDQYNEAIKNLTDQLNAPKIAQGESCATCHNGTVQDNGAAHQAKYKPYADESAITVEVDSATLTTGTVNGTGSASITVYIEENGQPLDVAITEFTAANGRFRNNSAWYINVWDTTTNEGFLNKGYTQVNYTAAALKDADDAVVTPASDKFTVTKGAAGYYTLTRANLRFIKADNTTHTYVDDDTSFTAWKNAVDANATRAAYVVITADPTDLSYGSNKLFDNVAEDLEFYAGTTPTYVGTANVSACVNCHGGPYMKHARLKPLDENGLYSESNGDFVSCKICHQTDRTGSHTDWQVLKDTPARYAEIQNDSTKPLTSAEKTKYAYTANLMSDVHMSHNMEFAYPQGSYRYVKNAKGVEEKVYTFGLKNCVTCHEGKLDLVLDNSNFVIGTCQSCHAIDNLNAKAKAVLSSHGAIKSLAENPTQIACNTCHASGGAKTFKEIHSGYEKQIYTSTSTTDLNAVAKYANNSTVDITAATYNKTTKMLNITITASSTLAAVDMTKMVPTVVISGYGYDSKDFIVSGHTTLNSKRLGEAALVAGSTTLPNFSNITKNTAGGVTTWTATYDVSALDSTDAKYLTNGAIKKIEIGVMPTLRVEDYDLALNAPSKTFDLTSGTTGAFVTDYVGSKDKIVEVAGCNKCHDSLGTTFHGADRGGNVTVCRECHVVGNGGSHLEMQSRSIDSYVHALHSFQVMDSKDVDFSDAVEALEYEHHVESTYPMFTLTNCESCHKTGTYDVPDQSKSLPGVLSAAYTWTKDRNIGTVASAVTGPASRACGSCHRSHYINEDEAGDLANLNAHVTSFGYYVTSATGVFDSVVSQVMALFK